MSQSDNIAKTADARIRCWIDKLEIRGEPNRGWMEAIRNYLCAEHGYMVDQFEEMTLGEVVATLKRIAKQDGRIQICESVVLLDGVPYPDLSSPALTTLAALIQARGRWVSSSKLHDHPYSVGRAHRVVKNLPQPLKNVIESRTGSGLRLTIFDHG